MLPLGKQLILFDGGFGSELERRGLEGIPEEHNVTHADEVRAIHRAYAAAGADIITANSFGLNRIKYKGSYPLETLVRAAVENARAAGKAVFFDVGPTGALLAPIGTLTFDEAYEAFAEVARLTADLVDGYIAETFSDLYELKACILALKEGKALSQEEIYACALLHDIGRESGEHASKSAALAEKILPQCGFDEKESARICEAIAEHGHDKEGNSALAELLCRADRLSRPCFACAAAGDCYWIKKNTEIVI